MLATTLLDRILPVRNPPVPVKAATGIGMQWASTLPPLGSILRDPSKFMRDAQALYRLNPWIRAAERTIGERFSTVTWHLEDDQDNEIDDESPDNYRAIWQLLERPYTPRPGDPQNSTPQTRSALWKITSRHMGLCGVSFWYLDQTESLAGTPLQILYLNPARVTPKVDAQGNLVDWLLDKTPRTEGIPLGLKNVLRFQLEPPDEGHMGIGLVETAMEKADISRLSDHHAQQVLQTGGKQGGVISPSDGRLNDEEFENLQRDVRMLNEGPDAAKRWLVLRGPIDYTRTASTPIELNLLEIAQMAKDDILAIWGVPATQLGVPMPAGLNSGGTKEADYEILWQNAVGPRLRNFRETLQFGLLDRYKALGLHPELEIEEPQFDDKFPQFELATQAAQQPLRNVERRKLMGLDPFGDPALDNAVWMPVSVVSLAQAPDETTGQIVAPPVLEAVKKEQAAAQPPPAKAKPLPSLGKLRDNMTDAMKRDLRRVLDAMKVDVAAKVRKNAEHAARKNDWDSLLPAKWDAELERVLLPHVSQIAEATDRRVSTVLAGKAGLDDLLAVMRKTLGLRIKGINEYTRERVRDLIVKGISDGLSPAQLGDLIEQAPVFDELRAETIARTETGTLLNLAATQSYRSYGVERVQVYDGEQDDICAAVDGATWTLEEAEANPLGHPNCTRDFAPIVGAA